MRYHTLLSFTFYANLVQIKPVSRLSLLENVLCNPCSLACFLSYFHFYVYMMQSHSWMSYLTKEYTEKEILYLENVNRTSLFTQFKWYKWLKTCSKIKSMITVIVCNDQHLLMMLMPNYFQNYKPKLVVMLNVLCL